MAWGAEFPVVAGTTKLNTWNVIKQLIAATIERGWGAGNCIFPHSSYPWVQATVTGATETTISTGLTWCGGTDDTSGISYPQPWNCGRTSFYAIPDSWDIVIDDNDPVKCIHTQVSSWTNTGVVTVPNLRDYVTSGRIPSIASLVGKTVYIIRGDYGIWWHERIMDWPNATMYAKSTVAEFHDDPAHPAIATNPTLTTIKDTGFNWTVNQFASGYEVLFYAADGFLKRATITGNTTNTLTFASQGSVPTIGDNYLVVAAGAVAEPNRGAVYPYTFYRGALNGYATHLPDDSTGGAGLPSRTLHTPGAGPSDDCAGYDPLSYDQDIWTEFDVSDDDAACGRPSDKCYTPNVYKTLRGLQVLIESISNSYVAKQDYDGAGAIPRINPAMMFSLAGINSYTGTTGSVAGAVGNDGSSNNTIAVSGITLPYYPIQICYSVIRNDTSKRGDDVYNWGYGIMLDAATLLSDGGSFTQSLTDTGTGITTQGDDGRSIVISTMWTRFTPRTFKRMFDIDGVFIPDIKTDSDTGVQSPVDPAAPIDFPDTSDCYGVGSYQKRAKSTSYIQRKFEDATFSNPQGFAWETGDAFSNGDVARYVGDNFADPTVYSSPLTTDSTGAFSTGVLAPYYDHYYIGALSATNQPKRVSQHHGTTSDGGAFWLSDASQNWFDFQWFSGTMRTESGTADGGSTTTLSDSTKTDTSQENHCYWIDSRFRGFDGPYVGFTVGVLISGTGFDDPDAVIEERLITSGDNTSITIGWNEPLSVSASGLQYQIKEPYYLNRFKDRQLMLIAPDGTSHTTTITGNSDDAIFFTPISGVTVAAGWKYSVVEPQTGTVWKRVSGSWVEATSGSDSTRLGVTTPHDFKSASANNLPTYKKTFGRMVVGDAITAQLYNEMYAALNVLVWAKFDITWVTHDEQNTNDSPYRDSAYGYADGSGLSWGTSGYDMASELAEYADDWSAGTYRAESAGAPYAHRQGLNDSGGCHIYQIGRRYAYAQVNGVCDRQTCGAEFFDYGVNPYNQPDGSGVVFDNYGDAVNKNVWTSFGSGTGGSSTINGPKLGSGAIPNNVPFPLNVATWEGYEVADQTAILKWNVAGGFVYQ